MAHDFWRLRADLRSSLVTMARRRLPDALKEGRAEVLSHDQEKLLRREEAVQRQLNAAVERYAAALELFDQWRAQGVKTAAELERALGGKSEPEQLAELRRQIEMRTVGCGWTHFETKWGFFSDERSDKIEDLKRMLLDDILPYEIGLRRLKKLPTEARRPRSALR